MSMVAKDFENLLEGLTISKQDDGRYRIVAVSTAALKDREGETFTTEAIDNDIKLAKESGDYPEFRVFHQKGLGFGRVTEMRRVGIFAVDEGYSYDDPFSISICEKMLVPNPGKWKVSRGFYIMETSGGCPSCGTELLIGTKQMKIGFRCPKCQAAYIDYKGVLEDVHFRRTKTFDITVTDKPAVPWTGVAAFRDTQYSEEFMNKKELKQRLLQAGLPEDAVDERLNSLSDAQLKEYSDVPFAEVLKEFASGEDDTPLDLDEVVKEFTSVVEATVEKKMKEVLANFELTISDIGDLEVDMKEVGELVAMKEAVEAVEAKLEGIEALLGKLVKKEDERLKEMLDDMPRAGKLRIRRYKQDVPEDEEDSEEGDDEDPEEEKEFGVVYGTDGNVASSMTEWLQSKK